MSHSKWIAVLSDTHGVLPAFILDALRDNPPIHIIHAGDVCAPEIIAQLRKIAPISHVRGNMDSHSFGPATEAAQIDGLLFYILHNLYDLDLDPKSAGVAAVIHGHLHRPSIEWKRGILFLNPGSCSYPRGDHPPSFARIELGDDALHPEIVYQK
ncbi:MAG: YfcE family phosphodiesterase [Deltaproteobacteria bacterium]|nr:YfcE family phosphodiesterase [Deltaproteobacteria bacterium]